MDDDCMSDERIVYNSGFGVLQLTHHVNVSLLS